jgi:hypothetical protein
LRKTGLKVGVCDRLGKPSPRPGRGGKRKDRPVVEGGKRDHEGRQHQEAENRNDGDPADEAQRLL